MYLDEDAVRSTLEQVEKLAPGSSIAFDYFSRELVFNERPFLVIGKLVTESIKLYYGESLRFRISTRRPARDQVSSFVEQTGLTLAEYEPVGKKVLLGGLALAVKKKG